LIIPNPRRKNVSNIPGSLKSSIGVFVTDRGPYIGGNGYSLRMRGLEDGINDNAYRRDIVIHGAWYVNADTIRRYGAIGRSWGCPAVSDSTAKSLIDTIKENTLIFAYYPDKHWLSRSKYVNV
jgi:L,D-transpeptidase catalytic domain